MKEIKNCKNCNMVFSTYEGAVLCKKCEAEEEETYKRVREYLYDNPGISVSDLSLKLNISIKRINQYVQNGRFELIIPRNHENGKK